MKATDRTKILYLLCVGIIVFLMWLGNEGANPLAYKGSQLQYSVGALDSDYGLLIRESVARSGIIASTPELVMNRGKYRVDFKFETDREGNVLELWEQGSKVAGWTLAPDENLFSTEFTLSKDAKQLAFKMNYGGNGTFTVKEIILTPDTLFYTDTYFMIALFLLCALAGYLLYQRHLENPLAQDKLIDACIIAGVALLATSPMFSTYLYNGDDLCYHLARIEGIKDGILDGQIPVIIMPDGLKGNGYLNAMYPYLFLYIGAFLRICRVSIGLSYKMIIFLANLGSAVCAYYAFRSMSKSRRTVILAVVLYTLMPYRFTNIFSRGDLGETLALTFWPLVIAGMYHVLMGNREKWYYLTLGFSGILQSHILSVMFVMGFCVISALVFAGDILKEKRYLEIGKAAGVTVLLNLWFVVPFLYYYFQQNLGTDILRWSGYFEQSINPSNLTQTLSLYNKQYFSLGLPLLGCAGIGVLHLICDKKKNWGRRDCYLLYLFVLGCILTYMITGYFPSMKMRESAFLNSIMTMLQFPWRFLGPACACFLFVGAIWLSESEILKPYKNLVFALFIGLNLLTILSVPTDNTHMPYEDVGATASKGHDSKMAANIGIFYPHEWRLSGIEDEQLTTSVIASDLNNVQVLGYRKEGTKVQTKYLASQAGEYIELPVLNYAGYRAYDENGKKLEIIEGNQQRIRIMLTGDGREHMIYLRFGPVAGFLIADILSALTIAGWIYLRRRPILLRRNQGK
ncbi:MAG: 6-pyruvoyl-tetrahydropterin synthase-related protein [Blautia sp.]|nr:6-pyruvoyl-tetrahydropterin synthase-related protein [Lachnoclostridium sp.]MCM1212271.1 6-pyruvoyl-tetrahydropterin synthase-related protein [Blautia sp.]